MRTFALTTKSTRKERVIETMGVMGPAVMLGVAFTNLPGIICLHWASGRIFISLFKELVEREACSNILSEAWCLMHLIDCMHKSLYSTNYRNFLFPNEFRYNFSWNRPRIDFHPCDIGILWPKCEQSIII